MRLTRLIGIVLIIAAAATSAFAAGRPGPISEGMADSAFSPDGSLYLVQARPHESTRLQLRRSGHSLRAVKLHGRYGFPIVAGSSEGVSRDGNTLVLISRRGGFAIVDAHTLRVRREVELSKDFFYDAVSPHARTLYLIQHVASRFSNRYYVRVYDLEQGRLLKKPIFDTREKWSLMSGQPVTRATSASGRWVYTLYTRPGGKPFVHSLDSVHRKAVCVDLPWMRDQSRLFRMRLQLSRDERKLRLRSGSGVVATIDTRTFRVS